MSQANDFLEELITEGAKRDARFPTLVDEALRRREAARKSLPSGVPFEAMAVTTKKLDVKIGDRVEIDGREYDVIADKVGGVTLEAAVTQTVDEIVGEQGGRALTPEEFAEHFGHLPSDGEG